MKSSKELKEEIAELERQRDDLTSQIRAKNIAYLEAISDESTIKKGDKVSVVTNGRKEVGVFGGFHIKYGEVKPFVYKIKKDGTASTREIWVYYYSKMEAI